MPREGAAFGRTMQKREKILAAVVGLLLVAVGGNWLFERTLQGPLEEKRATVERLKREIDGKTDQLRQARQAGRLLDEWNKQSLPSDEKRANQVYTAWLLELVERAGFDQPKVDSVKQVRKQGIYNELWFSVAGRVTLDELTRFLYDFYRVDHLHQIERLSISPVRGSQELDVTLSIAALALPGADRKDTLTKRISTRLASAALADYLPLVERNVFGEGGGSGFDAADFAVLTAINYVDGRAEAWFHVRTTDQRLKLAQGERFEVGQFRGVIAEIDAPDVIIESGDERWLLTLGESLPNATALPPEF